MKKIILPCLLLLLLLSIPSGAQDVLFSQLYANPLYLNPAFAGSGTTQRIGLNYRNEWPGIPGNYVTCNIAYDRNIVDSNNGIGFLANMDNGGYLDQLTTYNVSVMYARQFHIKSLTISAGVQGTFRYKSIIPFTGESVEFVYIAPLPIVTRTVVRMPDFSAGVLGYGKNYFAGFSIDHFTQPNESFYAEPSRLPIKYTFNGGLVIPLGKSTISPTVLLQKQGNFNQQVIEGYYSRWHLTGGIGTRFTEVYDQWQNTTSFNWSDLLFTIGYQNKFMRVGYSYDAQISDLLIATGGTHEVSLTFLFHYKCPKLKRTTGINCPTF